MIVNGIVTSFEWAALIVAVIVLTLPSSAIIPVSKSIVLTLGMSSLKRFKVTSVSLDVALTNVPKVKIMVSRASTSESSNPLVDIVTVPVFNPVAIVIELDETVNSVVSVAVPPTVNGISTNFPLGSFKVAVKVTSLDEFSSILGELKENNKDDAVSSSVIVSVLTSVIVLVAFSVDVLGVIMIVSLSS